MSVRYLLDTDTASFIIKRRSPSLMATLMQVPPRDLAISAVTEAELRYGLMRLPEDHRLHVAVDVFLSTLQVLPWSAAAPYARIRQRLTTGGLPIGELDMMIAAHAIAMDAVLVTSNTRHFARIAGLRLENWCADLDG